MSTGKKQQQPSSSSIGVIGVNDSKGPTRHMMKERAKSSADNLISNNNNNNNNSTTNIFKYHHHHHLNVSNVSRNPIGANLRSSISTLLLPTTPLESVVNRPTQLGGGHHHHSNLRLSFAASSRLTDLAHSHLAPLGNVGDSVRPTLMASIASSSSSNGCTLTTPTSLWSAIASLRGGNRTLVSVSSSSSAPPLQRPPTTTTTTTTTTPSFTNVEQIYNLPVLRLPNTKSKRTEEREAVGEQQSHQQTPSNNNSLLDEQAVMVASDGSGMIREHIAEQVINAIGNGGGNGNGNGNGNVNAKSKAGGRMMMMGLAQHKPDGEKLQRIQKEVEGCISQEAKQQIVQILDRVATLKPLEKLLLYLRLPSETPETDPLRQPQNPLGTRSEIIHSINWVRTHLEQDSQVSIPKQDVYNDYMTFCDRLKIKPLSTADFGKVMKQVFPGIRPRRLGTRGHSRYCYAAMRKTSKLPAPKLPQLFPEDGGDAGDDIRIKKEGDVIKQEVTEMTPDDTLDSEHEQSEIDDEDQSGQNDRQYPELSRKEHENNNYWKIVKDWAEKILQRKVDNLKSLAYHIQNPAKTMESSSSSLAAGKEGHGGRDTGPGSLRTRQQQQRDLKEKRPLMDAAGTPLKKRHKKKRKGLSVMEEGFYGENSNASDPGELHTSGGKKERKTTTMSIRNISHSMEQSVQTDKMIDVEEKEQDQEEEEKGEKETNNNPPIVWIPFTNMKTQPPSPIVEKEKSNANVYCKKVLKAQQIKGFGSVAMTTNTVEQQQQSSSSSSSSSSGSIRIPSVAVEEGSTSVRMGPPPPQPTQLISSSTSNSSGTWILQEDASGAASGVSIAGSLPSPKVISRNLQQLRVRKYLMPPFSSTSTSFTSSTQTTSTTVPPLNDSNDSLGTAVVKDTDLPENLGLPRERMISICNMDKHELDDYFLPVEEENSEDQETELLQYFQFGEKATISATTTNTTITSITTSNTTGATTSTTTGATTSTTTCATTTTSSTTNTTTTATTTTNNNNKGRCAGSITRNTKFLSSSIQSETVPSSTIRMNSMVEANLEPNLFLVKTELGLNDGNGGFSSTKQQQQSLQMQKPLMWQQQQQRTISSNNHQTPTPVTTGNKMAIKRKLNINAITMDSEITAARKSCSFLPISANVNPFGSIVVTNQTMGGGRGGGGGGGVATTTMVDQGIGLFASPNPNTNRPPLIKQQSLDCNSSDPMIGCGRRKRFVNVNSASAPPSPKAIFQQQEQEQQQLEQQQNNDDGIDVYVPVFLPDEWSPPIENQSSSSLGVNQEQSVNGGTSFLNSILVDQNSLELDMLPPPPSAGAAAGATTGTTTLLYNNSHSAIGIVNDDLNNDHQSLKRNSYAQDLITTYRSQSVPLSQRGGCIPPTSISSPTTEEIFYKRSFQFPDSGIMSMNNSSKTPISNDFGDSTTTNTTTTAPILSDSPNSCSQQQFGGRNKERDTLLDMDMEDMTAILSSTKSILLANGSVVNNNSGNTPMGMNLLSSSSSSGYGSSFGTSNNNNNNNNTVTSRSVPCTPLPQRRPLTRTSALLSHHHMSSTQYNYEDNDDDGGVRERLQFLQMLNGDDDGRNTNPDLSTLYDGDGDDLLLNSSSSFDDRGQLNTATTTIIGGHSVRNGVMSSISLDGGENGGNSSGGGGHNITAKSMPSTPISGPWQNFRYSPMELTRDFLINGNTIDGMGLSTATAANATSSSSLTTGFMVEENHFMDDSASSSAPSLSSGTTTNLLLAGNVNNRSTIPLDSVGGGVPGDVTAASLLEEDHGRGKTSHSKSLFGGRNNVSNSTLTESSSMSVIGGNILTNI